VGIVPDVGEHRPPLVAIPHLGVRGHLVAWHRHHDVWWGCVHHLDLAPPTHRGPMFDHYYICVRGDALEPIPGWDYNHVPRAVHHK
jgi:hypothetical protein